MNHDAYVLAAYLVSATVIGATILWVVLDDRGRRRDLAALEAAGIKRRSDA